jgi:hypothetical protein
MIRAIYAFAAIAALAAVPTTAKEWSKDKTWTVTEFNEGACLMRPKDMTSNKGFQIIEAVDHNGSLAVTGLPGTSNEPATLSYSFTSETYMTVLVRRAQTYITHEHNSIDTLLWKVPAQPASLYGKPAYEMQIPRNFLDLYAELGTLMLSTEDKPMIEGFYPYTGAADAIAALRECNKALSAKLAKGTN